ncbi:MAG: FtsQ-type POTRA domain-containing protein [Chthonomonadales bacterium]|nr:FtsQ-type POTRA domain-containing protein [Chthonomonadales bacterium]
MKDYTPGYRSARENAARRASARWGWITACLTLAAAGVSVAAALTSPAITVRRVRVVMPALPLESESRCTLSRAALPPGVRLALMDVRGYADALRRLPWVRSVTVRRGLDGTVTAEVEVRSPVARLVCGGRRWEVDDDGVIIRPARRDLDLPEIVMNQAVPVCRGARVEAENVLGAIAALALSRGVSGLTPVSITVDQTDGICFNNGDNIAVWLGRADDLPYKMAVVERIYRLEPPVADRLVSVDVSVPQMPTGTRGATARNRPSVTPDAG